MGVKAGEQAGSAEKQMQQGSLECCFLQSLSL